MDAHRESCWRWIVESLCRSRKSGTILVYKEGRRMRSGIAVPLPDEAGERLAVLEEVEVRLLKLAGCWSVRFVEEGQHDRDGATWPWPPPEGLFAAQAEAEKNRAVAGEPNYFTAPVDPPESVVGAHKPIPPGLVTLQEPAVVRCYEVCWPGAGVFVLDAVQREVVRLLVRAYLSGGDPDVAQRDLLDWVGSDAPRLSGLFAGNAAWGRLILPGRAPSSYRIAAAPPGEDAPDLDDL